MIDLKPVPKAFEDFARAMSGLANLYAQKDVHKLTIIRDSAIAAIEAIKSEEAINSHVEEETK